MGRHVRVDIVGAGPVGLGLAIQVLHAPPSAPPDVHVWERAVKPHSTPCGEGILASHVQLVPGIDHGRHVRSRISAVHVTGPAPPTLVFPADAVVMDRPRWIEAMADHAESLGATFHWGSKIHEQHVPNLPGDVVVGVDGPASQVARFLGARRAFIPALQARFASPAPDSGAMKFFWNPAETSEYAWVFPRAQEASVGLLGPSDEANRQRVLALAIRHGLEGRGARFQSWPIPVGGRLVQRGRYCLLGDAAGAAHPLTKAGIGPGLLQSRMLSQLILENRANTFQEVFRTSPLWPRAGMQGWNALRRSGASLWNRTRWPHGLTVPLTRRSALRILRRNFLRNIGRPRLLLDGLIIARGLRQAVRYGW